MLRNTIRIVLVSACAVAASLAEEPSHNQLTEAERTAGWRLLFNGRDLTGWEPKSAYQSKPVKWTVADGVIRGGGEAGYLCTTDEYADFEMSLSARIWDTRPDGKGHGNSGVKIRCQRPLPYPAEFYPFAYEVQLDNADKRNPTGSIYDLLSAKHCKTADREWISLRFRVVGNRFEVWVNDELVTDGADPKSRHSRGFIALQMHHSTNVVEFRDIKIRPIATAEKP